MTSQANEVFNLKVRRTKELILCIEWLIWLIWEYNEEVETITIENKKKEEETNLPKVWSEKVNEKGLTSSSLFYLSPISIPSSFLSPSPPSLPLILSLPPSPLLSPSLPHLPPSPSLSLPHLLPSISLSLSNMFFIFNNPVMSC